jgi:hypothetical protein
MQDRQTGESHEGSSGERRNRRREGEDENGGGGSVQDVVDMKGKEKRNIK